MTTLTITNLSKKVAPKPEYTVEELVAILLKKLDYSVEIEAFSDEENNEILKFSNGRYEQISNLVD